MIKFTSILENSNIMYLRHIQDHIDFTNDVFQYCISKDIEKDNDLKHKELYNIGIIYSEFKAKYGDKIYLTILFDQWDNFFIYPYINIYDAVGKALELWKHKPNEDYYFVKVLEDIIDIKDRTTARFFENDKVLINCHYHKQDLEDYIKIDPELSKDDKIKHLMLSYNSISKFNL